MQTRNEVLYTLGFENAHRHLLDVEMSFEPPDQKACTLMMPVWTPGSYLVREYAKNIETLQAWDADSGRELKVLKRTKNRWEIACDGLSAVRVAYRVYCRELSVRTNWLERDFGFLTGAATFLVVMESEKKTHRIRFRLPTTWQDVATSLTAVADEAGRRGDIDSPWQDYVAPSYDVLVDSPLLFGALKKRSFLVHDREHWFVNVLGEREWNEDQAILDIAKIVEREHRFWKEVPYQRYWFLNIACESYGGLEHDDSTVLMSSRWAMKKRKSYLDWLSLVSHEFFHLWNVRRLRPRALVNYDYETETLFEELWIAEGITSYYDDLIVSWAGLMTQEEYLGRLSETIATVQNGQGRMVQSLSESSFDTWIKFYRPDENAINSRVSYYTKGALVAMLLDCEIQKRSSERYCLGDAMRLLWQGYCHQGYTRSDFESIVEELVGTSMAEWFTRHIDQPMELDYSPFLEWYGLRFQTDRSESMPEGACGDAPLALQRDAAKEAWLGCEAVFQEGKVVVKKIPRHTPADLAGINVEDEIVAIDSMRVGADWSERVALYAPGASVTILLARRGRLLERTATLWNKPEERWRLKPVEQPTEAQAQRLVRWLSQPSLGSPPQGAE